MTKFQDQATEALYASQPDDEYGQSLDGWSWYGLYRATEALGGSIVIEDTLGFVGRSDFETNQALELAWSTVTTEEDLTHMDRSELVGLWEMAI